MKCKEVIEIVYSNLCIVEIPTPSGGR